MHEFNTLTAIYVRECCTSRLAPLGLVVTHDNVVRHLQQIEARFHLFHATAVTIVGQVARHQYEVDAVRCIDLCYRAQQVLGWLGVAGCEVDICQLGKAETFLLCPYACGQQKQQDAGNKLICLDKG